MPRQERDADETSREANASATWQRLQNQVEWYSKRSQRNQRLFKALKAGQLIVGALIPILAVANSGRLVLGTLGAAVLVIEGIQQMNQYQANWISYRSTAEALKHEKYLYLAKAGPYATAPNTDALLAESIEGLISREHTQWISSREEAVKRLESKS